MIKKGESVNGSGFVFEGAKYGGASKIMRVGYNTCTPIWEDSSSTPTTISVNGYQITSNERDVLLIDFYYQL